jgi:hypothetical protein
MRNKYYLDQSGKAVTGAEALRNYGAVPQPGDTPEVIDEKMKIMSKGVQDTINVYRQMFTGLPAIQVQPGMNTGVAAGEKINPYATATPTIVQPQVTPSSGWDDAKEQRLQELRAKQRGAQSGTQ